MFISPQLTQAPWQVPLQHTYWVQQTAEALHAAPEVLTHGPASGGLVTPPRHSGGTAPHAPNLRPLATTERYAACRARSSNRTVVPTPS